MDKAYLFGPIIGELEWEVLYFVPHVLYLKNKNPNKKFVVLTRKDRFDLYGKNVDILVGLDLEDIDTDGFKMNNLDFNKYKNIISQFHLLYRNKYFLENHLYPKINNWLYKVKWQFPRDEVSYNFSPRYENFLSAHGFMVDKKYVTDDILEKINIIYKNTTKIGIAIECLKKSKCYIGDIKNSLYAKLALLLKIPVIHIETIIKEDEINLLNPLKTKVLSAETLNEGIKIANENFI